MVKVCCDRCGREIESKTYYEILIYAKDAEGRSFEEFSHNLAAVFNDKKHYCENCINDIKWFIANPLDETIRDGKRKKSLNALWYKWIGGDSYESYL